MFNGFLFKKLFVSSFRVLPFDLDACMGICRVGVVKKRCELPECFYNAWGLWVQWFLKQDPNCQSFYIHQWGERSQRQQPQTEAQAAAWERMQGMFLYQVYIMLDQKQQQLQKEMEDKANAEEEANKEKERKRKVVSAAADARWCLQQPHEFVQYKEEAQLAEKQAKDAAARELLQKQVEHANAVLHQVLLQEAEEATYEKRFVWWHGVTEPPQAQPKQKASKTPSSKVEPQPKHADATEEIKSKAAKSDAEVNKEKQDKEEKREQQAVLRFLKQQAEKDKARQRQKHRRMQQASSAKKAKAEEEAAGHEPPTKKAKAQEEEVNTKTKDKGHQEGEECQEGEAEEEDDNTDKEAKMDQGWV